MRGVGGSEDGGLGTSVPQILEVLQELLRACEGVAVVPDLGSAVLSARSALEFLDPSDPLAQVGPGENLYAIHSRLYRDQPLILRGPAAGPELTAVALQSDLFRLCQYLNRQHRQKWQKYTCYNY